MVLTCNFTHVVASYIKPKPISYHNTGRPPFIACFSCYFLYFPFFFPFVTENDEKTCFKTEANDFDQLTACRAPICLSKYTTLNKQYNLKETKNLTDGLQEIPVIALESKVESAIN